LIAAMAGLVSASGVSAASPARQSDAVLSREMLGYWVASASPPSGNAAFSCETDSGDSFEPRGVYSSLFEEGSWAVKNGVLTIRVTRSNADTGGEGAMRQLKPPQVRTMRLESVRNGVAKVRWLDRSSWLGRCDG
jgi:hypothetical protein